MNDIAYHFTGSTLRDGSPIPPIGKTLVFEGDIELCGAGYHWSRTPWQALQYAPGPILHRVRIGGAVIEEQDDKGVSSERTILASVDLTFVMLRFAADQALSVAHLWDMPEVVREYLTTLDETQLDAARDAARGAARDAARGAARNAAWSAARDAAWSATWDAARGAARDAARGAARNAAWAAAWDAAWDVARASPWDAARAAAWDDFNHRAMAALDEAGAR